MSTVDPDAARRARAARTPQQRDQVLPGILTFAGAGILAASISSMGNSPDDWSVELSTFLMLLGAAGSVIGALAAFGGVFLWVGATIKNPRLLGWSMVIALGLLGAGIGTAITGQAVLPIVLIAVGAVLAILGVIVWRRRNGHIDVEDEIIRTTTPVTGVVTNQGYSHFSESSRILTSVTYAFTDAQGTRRFVQRSAVIDARDPIVEGEAVDIWYDRQNPSDEKRIVVRRRR